MGASPWAAAPRDEGAARGRRWAVRAPASREDGYPSISRLYSPSFESKRPSFRVRVSASYSAAKKAGTSPHTRSTLERLCALACAVTLSPPCRHRRRPDPPPPGRRSGERGAPRPPKKFGDRSNARRTFKKCYSFDGAELGPVACTLLCVSEFAMRRGARAGERRFRQVPPRIGAATVFSAASC